MRAGTEDPAEILAAEIVEAFRESGLKPVGGDYFHDDSGDAVTREDATCACAVGAVAYVEGIDPPSNFEHPVNGIPAEHVQCVTAGFDGTLDDLGHYVPECGHVDCHYFQAGVLAAHAMETTGK